MHSIENLQKKHESELWQLQKQINELDDNQRELIKQLQELSKILFKLDYCHEKNCEDHIEKASYI